MGIVNDNHYKKKPSITLLAINYHLSNNIYLYSRYYLEKYKLKDSNKESINIRHVFQVKIRSTSTSVKDNTT